MIVRDEAHVITEVLEGVAPHIDYWVIVDTGSVDQTMEVVEAFFDRRRIPGELHQRPWRDFGTNRTEALDLASGKADYTWVIDADDLVVGDIDLRALEADAYSLRYGTDLTWWRTQIFRSHLPWRYVGVLHEYPHCPGHQVAIERLGGEYHLLGRTLGGRSADPDKYGRDAAVLETAHRDDPTNPRTVFYLAQSYRDAGRTADALNAYERLIQMGSWDEEVYVARLERARCMVRLGDRWPEAQAAYLEAWAYRPHRGEALHDLARHHRLAGDFELAHLFASRGVELAYPTQDQLFVAADVHRWRLLDEASISAYYVGRFEQSEQWCRRLLSEGHLPRDQQDRVETNLGFALDSRG